MTTFAVNLPKRCFPTRHRPTQEDHAPTALTYSVREFLDQPGAGAFGDEVPPGRSRPDTHASGESSILARSPEAPRERPDHHWSRCAPAGADRFAALASSAGRIHLRSCLPVSV
jgi:hypothetical protein